MQNINFLFTQVANKDCSFISILDGAIRLFKRPNSHQWHCRFKLDSEVPKRLKPWWFVSSDGKVCFSVRYGSHILELAKGKMSVQVDSAADLVKAIEQLKKAVEDGVLDAQIEQASKHLSNAFKS